MKHVVVTGANRGIGLDLTRAYLQAGWAVTATARKPDQAQELNSLRSDYSSSLYVEALDVGDQGSVDAFAGALAGKTVDVLINNAGVYLDSGRGFEELPVEVVAETFGINVLGPMRLSKALLPQLRKSDRAIVANMSSKMGSVADNSSGGSYAYRISKAALNMHTKSFAIDYPEFTAITLHPGWVQTDMGGNSAPTSAEESARGLMKVINDSEAKDSGKFIDFRGDELPW